MAHLVVPGLRGSIGLFVPSTGHIYSLDKTRGVFLCAHESVRKYFRHPGAGSNVPGKPVQCSCLYPAKAGDKRCEHPPHPRDYLERLLLLWSSFHHIARSPHVYNGSTAVRIAIAEWPTKIDYDPESLIRVHKGVLDSFRTECKLRSDYARKYLDVFTSIAYAAAMEFYLTGNPKYWTDGGPQELPYFMRKFYS